MIIKKNLQKKWIHQILFIPLQAQISPRQHGEVKFNMKIQFYW